MPMNIRGNDLSSPQASSLRLRIDLDLQRLGRLRIPILRNFRCGCAE
jgi:hypothetical protein